MRNIQAGGVFIKEYRGQDNHIEVMSDTPIYAEKASLQVSLVFSDDERTGGDDDREIHGIGGSDVLDTLREMSTTICRAIIICMENRGD